MVPIRLCAVHVLISILVEALLTVHAAHLTWHHVRAGYAASVVQIELIGDVVLTVAIDSCFTAASIASL